MAADENTEEKKKKKKEKGNFEALATDSGAMYVDGDTEEGGGLAVVIVVFFIVVIWLAILALLIKLDIGGFGSNVLYSVLKDVPVVNKILPDDAGRNDAANINDYATIADAVAEINRLQAKVEALEKAQNDTTASPSEEMKKEIETYKEEIRRLQTFENSQIDFQKVKTEFYEEVVFSNEAPSIEEYKKYYESIDPENAEYIYRQVILQLEEEKQLKEYIKTYSEMKPKQAAAILETMTADLDLVAKILKGMEPANRAKVLGLMDRGVAANITKILDPD